MIPAHTLYRFGWSVFFFPQLIAGPIVHARDLLSQLNRYGDTDKWASVSVGSTVFLIGLAKKLIIADTVAPWSDALFANPADATFLSTWTGVIAYAVQIYFDFSGYSDMAIGLGMMFGITLPTNFSAPYLSTNVTEFWRRWHMTLGAYLRDYIYIPLGGSRHGQSRQLIALMTTMLLGGLWHGAGWQFLFWGFLHGAALCVHRIWLNLGYRMSAHWGLALTFFFVVLAWVPFRANNLSDAFTVLNKLFSVSELVSFQHGTLAQVVQSGWRLFVMVIGLYVWARAVKVLAGYDLQLPTRARLIASLGLSLCCVMSLNSQTTFLYWAF